MTEIRPIQTDGTTSSLSSSTENFRPSILNASIFADIDTSGDGYISPEEAKKYGFCAWQIKEKISKADFEAQVKTYNETRIAEKQTQQNSSSQNNNAPADSEMANFKRQMEASFSWIFDSDEQFEQEFEKLVKKHNGNMDYIDKELFKIQKSLPQKVMLEKLNRDKWIALLLDKDFIFDDVDMAQYPLALKHLSFYENTFSKVSKEHLPEGFNPQEIFEKGKTIGLGIDKAHKAGYTGQGVSYAIIDSGVAPHNDLKFKEYKVSSKVPEGESAVHFHGGAVSYIAQEIAPDADCYYFALQNGAPKMKEQFVDNLRAILEKNKSLPADKKIRVVSVSMPLYGGEEAKKIADELEKQGVWVFYSGCEEDRKRGYLGKIDPNGNPDDFNNYRVVMPCGAEEAIVLRDKLKTATPKERKDILEYLSKNKSEPGLYVNSGDRTVPDPSSASAYRHDSQASQSWSIPVIAGYYTLACQADPTMNKERFLALANETSRKVRTSISKFIIGEQGYTDEKPEIKIIDINALLEKIQADKK